MKTNHKTLAKNTAMLYLLNFSAYAFALLLVPYETRVFGSAIYGVISFAATIMGYFLLVIDYGFLLSATEDISKHREDAEHVSSVVWSVMVLKLALAALCFLALVALAACWDKIGGAWNIMLPYFLYTVLTALVPDFLFRGMERMKAVTYRTVCIRAITVALVFIFIRKPEDYVRLPWFLVLESAEALAISLWYARKGCGLRRPKVIPRGILAQMRHSSLYFLSRISSSVYTTSNMVVLSAACSMSQVGLYASVSKLIVTGQTMLQPVSDSLFPYMVRNKDFRLARKLLLFGVPLVSAACLGGAVFADKIVVLLFGAGFLGAAPILRLMLPVVAFSLPNYIIAFPVLGAMGLSKKSNVANIVGAAVHAVQLTILVLTGNLTPERVAFAYALTEGSVLAYRAVLLASAIRARRKELAKKHEEDRSADAAVYR
jgi:polysaccharide transporter, PST family